jgi:hypothetical protein
LNVCFFSNLCFILDFALLKMMDWQVEMGQHVKEVMLYRPVQAILNKRMKLRRINNYNYLFSILVVQFHQTHPLLNLRKLDLITKIWWVEIHGMWLVWKWYILVEVFDELLMLDQIYWEYWNISKLNRIFCGRFNLLLINFRKKNMLISFMIWSFSTNKTNQTIS